MALQLNVAWGKQSFAVELPSTSFATLQTTMQDLTGVLAARQKFIVKGKRLQKDEDLSAVKPGSKVLMMGVASELPKPPEQTVVFMEDLSAEERADAGFRVGAGLRNLGNTCYMNSTLQALKGVPELSTALVEFASTNPLGRLPRGDAGKLISSLLGDLFSRLERDESGVVVPVAFTTALRSVFPQFNEQDEGRHKQQDAEECFSELVQLLSTNVKPSQQMTIGPVSARPAEDAASQLTVGPASPFRSTSSVVDQLFGGEITVRERCLDAPEEGVTQSTQTFWRVQCHIDSETNFMLQGLEKNLVEQIEKRSPTLDRNALYERTRGVSALPPYLVVQFVRFYWRSDTKTKAKICRRVKFPAKLDIISLADDDLSHALLEARKVNLRKKEEKLGIAQVSSPSSASASASEAVDGSQKMDTSPDADDEKAGDDSDKPPAHPTTSGYYQVQAAVTHQGRMADSGHYVGWVKQPGASADDDSWLMFDDDKVKQVKESDILQLDGGSVDWHMSYLLIYKRIDDMLEGEEQAQE